MNEISGGGSSASSRPEVGRHVLGRTSITSVSSGLGSAFAWKLNGDRYGSENAVGLFTDVNGEHPDNYRFLAEVQYRLGQRLVKVTNDGKTIWDVMIEQRFLANTRVDICSRILKREATKKWLTDNCDPATTTVSLGIDWTEEPRFIRARDRWAVDGWTLDAPLIDTADGVPVLKDDMRGWLNEHGIARPKLYDLGFDHANCGGGCVKAGHKQFAHLLEVDRWWYLNWWEAGEERVRRVLQRDDIAILRDRRGGVTRPLTLRELRHRLEGGDQLTLEESTEWGACDCFSGADDEVPVTIGAVA